MAKGNPSHPQPSMLIFEVVKFNFILLSNDKKITPTFGRIYSFVVTKGFLIKMRSLKNGSL